MFLTRIILFVNLALMLETIGPETSGDSLRKLTLKEHNLLQVAFIKRSGMKPEEWIAANSGKFNLSESDPAKRKLMIDYFESGDEKILEEIEKDLYGH